MSYSNEQEEMDENKKLRLHANSLEIVIYKKDRKTRIKIEAKVSKVGWRAQILVTAKHIL
jgi:hypothetical protein